MIDLTVVKYDWRETQGIKWRVVKSNRNWQIQVICPRCGRVGTLRWLRTSKNAKGFYIHHSYKPYDACRFGWTSEEYDVLKRIYSTALEIYRIALG